MQEKIIEMLSNKKFIALRNVLSRMNEADISLMLEDMAIENTMIIFRLLPKDIAAEVFVELSNNIQKEIISFISDKELGDIIDKLFVDDTVDLIEEMPANVVARIMRQITPGAREIINRYLQYPKNSVGSIMTNEYISFKNNLTVKEALEKIRLTGTDKETIYTCYVISPSKKLLGFITAKELLLSSPEEKIFDLMDSNVIYAQTTDNKEDAAEKIKKYNFLSIPVVDKEKRLVGIVTFDDAIDVLEEKNTEEMVKMAAIQPYQNTYFNTSIWTHAKSRTPWLIFLMLSATITGLILSGYEQTFAVMPILISFVPMLMSTGGNCGAQSSTMVIRSMATNEIKPKDFGKVIIKESGIALLCGAFLSLINAIRIWLMYANDPQTPKIVLLLSISLIFTILLAKILGCSLPLLAKLCRLDPALMASPLITTLVDALSVLLYFNLATHILQL